MNFKLKSINTNLSNVKRFINVSIQNIKFNHSDNNPEEIYNESLSSKTQKLKGGPTEGLLDPNDKSMNPNIRNQKTISKKFDAPYYDYENLNLETLETIYNTSQNASVTEQNPAEDLGATSFQTVDNFNQYIKDNVDVAGYGTRAGVVAAGLSLISGYNFATGKRLRYSQPYRQAQIQEGIVNQNFYLDCSSFAWWALYNGGFKIPTNSSGYQYSPYTGDQISWARNTNSLKPVNTGKPGDFLIYHQSQARAHIVLIVGNYDDGYYCAEFSSPKNGAVVSKRSYEDLTYNGYQVMDMEEYYSNPENIK